MALELNKNGFIDNSSCNRQSICILIDNSENVEPRIKDMIYESIELLFAKMKEQKSLIGRMDLAFVLLNRDEKDNIDFCPLQQSVLPDLMVKSQNLQSDSLKAGFLKAMYLLY